MESTSSRNLQRSRGGDGLSRGALIGAIGLVVLTLVLVFADQAADAVRGEQTTTSPETALRLRFEDLPEGAVAIYRHADGERLLRLSAEESSFLRTVVRSLVDRRERAEIPSALPFDLIRWSDGTMVLADPTNGQYMPLNGFGRDNERAFRRLFANAEAPS
jgi:putative photosynthetic complex assembly protein